MVILIGSTRAAKVEGARSAIEAIGAIDSRFKEARIDAIDVRDVAPLMPRSDRETLDGARTRARSLLDRVSGADLALGLEGGIAPMPVDGGESRHALISWAAATDGTRWGYGSGGAILLPEPIVRQVLDGGELGDVMDALAGTPVRGTRGAWGMLTRDLVGRRDAFKLAVVAALAPFYNPALYQSKHS